MRAPSSPCRVAVLALFLWSPLVVAQTPVARVRREQQLVLSERPAGTELELRLATGVTTVVRFDADVERAELKGVGREVRMDVAARFLLLQPREELPPGEPPTLEVVLAQGPARFQLRFPLVSHPSEVDSQVEVELRPPLTRSPPAPQPPVSPSEPDPFSRFLLSQDLKKKEAPAVTSSLFDGTAKGTGVLVRKTWDCRSGGKRHLALRVFNPVGGRPWLASEVVWLPPARGGNGRWRVVMEGPIAPGDFGTVVVEVPAEEATAPVRVEVREKDGERRLLLKEGR
ncbi:DUF2381 family protein [Archangium sp.]|uniref:DUF2381 family protein n=1 Tax=Archangium sp. TaxID=1872627 RepID=UPI00286D47B1|nr:DUF2381 family protein [Archangium sp.]